MSNIVRHCQKPMPAVALFYIQDKTGSRIAIAISCLVLYTPRAGRTLPAGEGGCAAGSLPPSHYLKLGPAVRCRSSPEFPHRGNGARSALAGQGAAAVAAARFALLRCPLLLKLEMHEATAAANESCALNTASAQVASCSASPPSKFVAFSVQRQRTASCASGSDSMAMCDVWRFNVCVMCCPSPL
jgi:hypothetical protein